MADFEPNSGATAPAQDTKPASIQPFISTPPETNGLSNEEIRVKPKLRCIC